MSYLRELAKAATPENAVELCRHLAERIDARDARIEALEVELSAYADAALYDALMSGPVFKGWNRSQLDRARRITEARRVIDEDDK